MNFRDSDYDPLAVEGATYYGIRRGRSATSTFDLDVEISAAEETNHRDSGPNGGLGGDYETTSYKIRA